MYLFLTLSYGTLPYDFWLGVDRTRSDAFTCYPFTPSGVALVDLWWETGSGMDSAISGVLADWLEDNRDHLLTGATGPDPAERLEQVIEWFRQHFERGSYAHSG